MTVTKDDFNKIWASTSSVPEYTFSDTDYKNGWEFVGNLPPTRAMWNKLQKRNDEKMQYLMENGTSWVDNVATLRTTNAKIGEVYGTKGYYTNNDGGQGFYIIRADASDTDDGGCIIILNNGNVAELIVDDTVSVKQFGAKGDGVTDDTNAFRNAFLMDKLYIPAGNYKITNYLIGTNEVKDEGTYVNLKPIFQTKDRLKAIEQFALKHSFIPVGDENMYGECMTFDTKRQKIILSFYWYTAPKKNVFLVLNKDTYAVEQTIDAPFPYAFNALSYNAESDTVTASGDNTAYIFDAGDLTSYTTISLPNSCSNYAHDNITGVDVVSKRSADNTFDIYVYTNNLETLLKTITTGSIRNDTAFQDCCAYNGKLYLMTWLDLFEIDLATESVNKIGIGSCNEFEGCEYIDDVFSVFLHDFGGKSEDIYQYMEDGTPQFYDRLSPNNIKTALDVSLDTFFAMGKYFVQTTDPATNNYPSGETKGYLIVTTNATLVPNEYNIIQEFYSLISPYNQYYRFIGRDNSLIKTVSDWFLSSHCLPLSGGTLTGTVTEEMEYPSTRNAYQVKYTGIESGVAPTGDKSGYQLKILDKNNVSLGGLFKYYGNAGYSHFRMYDEWGTLSHAVGIGHTVSNDAIFAPMVSDNQIKCGAANYRWTEVYAATGSINTSDERAKDNISAIPNDVLDAWGEVGWYQYQFKDALAEKGEKARIHTGSIAQRIKSVFEKHDLDAFRYGLLCYDEWEAEEELKDENGNITQEAREAGNRYSLRYEEALCMEAAYQRRRADRLEERIEVLEKLLMNRTE